MSDLPTPNDRVESLLMAILTGDGSDLPTPRTRTEKLLMAIYENGGTGGGGGEGVTPAQVKTILLANTDTALNGASSNPIANKALVDALADYVKSADLSIPTKVSELANDKKYQTDTDIVTALTPYAKSDDVTAEIIAEIAKVVAGAPESFDTLKEMSDWIAHHEDDATAMNSAISDNKNAIDALQDGKADKIEIPTTVAELTDSADYAKTTDIPTTLPANGGNADTVNNHNVESDVPVDAKFTDTVYDDTEVKGSIEELSSNLDTLEFGEVAGGKNVFDLSKIDLINVEYRNGVYTNKITDSKTFFEAYIDYWNDDSFIAATPYESFSISDKGKYSITGKIIEGCTKIRFKHNGTANDIIFFITPISYFGLKVGDIFTISVDVDEYNPSTAGGLIVKNIQIEKGSSVTPYEPYIPSVKMLAEEVNAQNESLRALGKCKNLLNPTLQTTTINGVTCTNNGDGTYTLNGTNTQSAVLYIEIGQVKIPNKNLVMLGSKNTNVGVYIKGTTATAYGNKITVLDSDKGIKRPFGLAIKQGVTITNEIVKPMLCENLNATYDDFVPYTGDGETLTHDVAELKNDLDKIKPSVIGSDWDKSWTYTVSSTTPKMFALHWANSTVIFCVFYGKVIPFNQPFDGETYTANVDGNTLTVTTSETGILRTI